MKFPGVIIRRVSEKPRNQSHQPVAWEAEIFNQWKESQKNQNTPTVIIPK
ncbi:hypothetical protein LEP1GSC170_2664 [Leptospira interrogans serovar Bataviae str. HAI135]|nr:hypothetical protein LEP1GSC170_2664 [Leptospira interrogans serovar Bataviae str. HAI135]